MLGRLAPAGTPEGWPAGATTAVAAALGPLLLTSVSVALGWGDRGPGAPDPSTASSSGAPSASPSASPSTTAAVVVRYRVERRTAEGATVGFADVVEQTLTDPRGWSRAGFRLVRDDSPGTPFTVVLAEADEVDRLCLPYDTYGRYSCQNGPVVALNADRWCTATPEWTGDLATYRQMLVNHEVGHLLGQHHPPSSQCPVPGRRALVMSQQSTELNGCLPNPWPLPAEVELAARHEEPLAPPYAPQLADHGVLAAPARSHVGNNSMIAVGGGATWEGERRGRGSDVGGGSRGATP